MQQRQLPSTVQAPAIASGEMARDPAALYKALRAQRHELTQQLDELESARQSLTMQLQRAPAGIQRQGLETRVMDLDARISAVDKVIAESQTEMSKVAGIPGAVVEEPEFIRQGPPEEMFILGTVFMLVVLLPLSIAFARRIWKRGANCRLVNAAGADGEAGTYRAGVRSHCPGGRADRRGPAFPDPPSHREGKRPAWKRRVAATPA